MSGFEPSSQGDAHSADVTASELAAFAYCAKAWHLERVLGLRPGAPAARARDAGIAAHAEHGRQAAARDRVPRWTTVITLLLLTLAAVLLVLAFRTT